MSFNHLCDKFTEETREFAQNLFEISPRAFKYVRQQFENALPHPSIVRKWVNAKHFYNEDILQNATFSDHLLIDDDYNCTNQKRPRSEESKRFKGDFEDPVNIEELTHAFDVGAQEFQNPDELKVQHILLNDQSTIPESFIHPSAITFTTVVDIF